MQMDLFLESPPTGPPLRRSAKPAPTPSIHPGAKPERVAVAMAPDLFSAEAEWVVPRREPLPVALDGVLRELEAIEGPTRKHGEMRSALKMTAKVLGRPLRDIPTDPPRLANLLADANPAVAGMTRQRFIRVRSLVLAALITVGLDLMPGRDILGHSEAWKALYEALPTKRLKYGLTRAIS
jgi:hypothetical protein